MKKHKVITAFFLLCAITLLPVHSKTHAAESLNAAVAMDVYKDPNCGCCSLWIEHMELRDFVTTVHHPADLNSLKLQHGIEPALQSCHTAVTKDGYVFEGHVPAKLVKQFLANPPAQAKGLLVPGMPMGSPGMEMGNRFSPYNVILLLENGSTKVYATITTAAEQFEE